MEQLNKALERTKVNLKLIQERCQKKNLTENTHTEDLSCNICNDVGYIFTVDTNTAKECECQIEVMNKRRLQNSGLDNVIHKYRFDNYEYTEKYQEHILLKAKDYIKRIQEDEKLWFYIGGQSGVGKSHICTAICNELMKMKKSLKYVIANKVILQLKSSVLDTAQYYKLMGQLISVDVLYIDDLFKSKNITDADVKVLFDIVNDRYIQNKITIISSEKTIFDLEQFEEVEAITGRIVEKAQSFIININKDSAKNYRKQKFLNL